MLDIRYPRHRWVIFWWVVGLTIFVAALGLGIVYEQYQRYRKAPLLFPDHTLRITLHLPTFRTILQAHSTGSSSSNNSLAVATLFGGASFFLPQYASGISILLSLIQHDVPVQDIHFLLHIPETSAGDLSKTQFFVVFRTPYRFFLARHLLFWYSFDQQLALLNRWIKRPDFFQPCPLPSEAGLRPNPGGTSTYSSRLDGPYFTLKGTELFGTFHGYDVVFSNQLPALEAFRNSSSGTGLKTSLPSTEISELDSPSPSLLSGQLFLSSPIRSHLAQKPLQRFLAPYSRIDFHLIPTWDKTAEKSFPPRWTLSIKLPFSSPSPLSRQVPGLITPSLTSFLSLLPRPPWALLSGVAFWSELWRNIKGNENLPQLRHWDKEEKKLKDLLQLQNLDQDLLSKIEPQWVLAALPLQKGEETQAKHWIPPLVFALHVTPFLEVKLRRLLFSLFERLQEESTVFHREGEGEKKLYAVHEISLTPAVYQVDVGTAGFYLGPLFQPGWSFQKNYFLLTTYAPILKEKEGISIDNISHQGLQKEIKDERTIFGPILSPGSDRERREGYLFLQRSYLMDFLGHEHLTFPWLSYLSPFLPQTWRVTFSRTPEAHVLTIEVQDK